MTSTEINPESTYESPTVPQADAPDPEAQDTETAPVTDLTETTVDAEAEQVDTEQTAEAEAEQDAEQDDEQASDPRLSKARQEAKGLRSRLRDAELEVGLSRATLGAMREDAAARLAAGRGGLADGGDLFKAGVSVDDLLTEDGTVDATLVAEAVAGVLAERPHWGWQPTKAPGRTQEIGGTSWYDFIRETKGQAAALELLKPGASGSDDEPAASWADVLRG